MRDLLSTSHRRSTRARGAATALVALLLALPAVSATPTARSQSAADARFFPETGIRIEDPSIWEYFSSRGGLATFGYPISYSFWLLGMKVQVFQRHVIHLRADGSVGVLDLLGEDFLPYVRFDGSVVPAADPAYLREAPPPARTEERLAYLRERVPEIWQEVPIGFLGSYLGAAGSFGAHAEDSGGLNDDEALARAFEVWGYPTSAPGLDENNHDWVYQRFQRGVFRYDLRQGRMDALLAGEYFKALLTGANLPPDLEADARSSRFYRQFQPAAPNGVARPADLPASNLLGAFVGLPPASLAPPALSLTSGPTIAAGLSSCQGDELMTFAPAAPLVGNELLIAVTSAKPHQYVRLTGPTTPRPLREREGQRGRVWEWVVELTFPGRHDYTFYVDSTVPCTANFVVVGPPPGATATPAATSVALLTPTPMPTATPIPTPTVTPLPTVIPTSTPQEVSAARSSISRTPTQQIGNRIASVAITVTLLDGAGQPIAGRLLRISSDRPTADSFSPGTDQWTNSQGQVTYTVSSCASTTVTSTYTVEDRSDGVTLSDRVTVTWTPGVTC